MFGSETKMARTAVISTIRATLGFMENGETLLIGPFPVNISFMFMTTVGCPAAVH